MICLLGLLIIPVLFYKQTHHLKASWILNHFSNLPLLTSSPPLRPPGGGGGAPHEIWIPIKNISSLSLFEIQFTIMSSHVEQSHCDTLSGFNHSESQREREGEKEKEPERESNDHFFFAAMVAGRCCRRHRPAQKPNIEECQRVLHLSHTHTHTHTELLFHQCHWMQTDG